MRMTPGNLRCVGDNTEARQVPARFTEYSFSHQHLNRSPGIFVILVDFKAWIIKAAIS